MPEMKSPLRMGSHRARTHMELIDTHCHLDVADFDADRDDVLAACRANGVTRIVIPGVAAAGWGNILALCEAQLRSAAEADLPVLLHVRKAHDEVISTLRRIRVKGGICHAYNGSLQQAHHYIDLGFKLSFGGMLTYARSSKLRGLARELPRRAQQPGLSTGVSRRTRGAARRRPRRTRRRHHAQRPRRARSAPVMFDAAARSPSSYASFFER